MTEIRFRDSGRTYVLMLPSCEVRREPHEVNRWMRRAFLIATGPRQSLIHMTDPDRDRDDIPAQLVNARPPLFSVVLPPTSSPLAGCNAGTNSILRRAI